MCSIGGWVHAALPLSFDATPSLARCRDKLPPWRRRGRGSVRCEPKLDRHVGVAIPGSVRKSKKGTQSMSRDTPTIMYLWNLYVLTSPAWSVATRKRTVEQTCPTSMKGQRRYFEGGEDDTRQKACYMKSHNAEILAFSKA